MKIQVFCLAIGFASLSSSAPSHPTHAIHEKHDLIQPDWIKRDRVSSNKVVSVRIGLAQDNLDKGHDLLMDISHPSSPNYGKHLSSEEVTALFAPSDETVDAVMNWLQSAGIPEHRITHSDNKGWLAFYATTLAMEDLLLTEYHEYKHSASGKVTVACEEYHVPLHLQEHIDYIIPGIKLPILDQATPKLEKKSINSDTLPARSFVRPIPPVTKQDLGDLSICSTTITPDCIKALYGVPPGDKASPSNSMGIFSQGGTYAQDSLVSFFANLTNIPPDTTPILASIAGGVAPAPPMVLGNVTYYPENIETDLDLMVSYPLVYPQTVTLFQVGNLNTVDLANVMVQQLLDAIDGSYCTYSAYGETGNDSTLDQPSNYNGTLQCGIFKPTNVISISYGIYEGYVPAAYQERQCNEFMKLGLQGTSVFFSSGDFGVAALGDTCFLDDGTLSNEGTIFAPQWPANCPYVTAVGATQLNGSVYNPEVAAVFPGKAAFNESFVNLTITIPGYPPPGSGGGFSNIYSTPVWQKEAVNQYYAVHDPGYPYYLGNSSFGEDGGLYNRLGRGYPDVSANGWNISIFFEDKPRNAGGTSQSAPIFASIINRINEERIAIGKGPVGFVNPVLYANPGVLNDITSGTNPGCGTPGFTAVKGWDPLTGLGTPNYPKMLKLFMSLP